MWWRWFARVEPGAEVLELAYDRRLPGIALGLALLGLVSACRTPRAAQAYPTSDSAGELRPPVAPREPSVTTIHGVRRIDPYAWLRNRNDPRVKAYLQAENAYAEAVMWPTEALQQDLYRRMLARIRETDASAPVRHGPFLYYTRTERGLDYRIHCRRPLEPGKPESDAGEEQILFDENALASGAAYFDFWWDVSLDHALGAYLVDLTGDERYTLRIRNLDEQRDLPDRIDDVSQIAWAADGKTIFYTVPDDTERPYEVRRHVIGDDPADDALVFREDDPAFYVSVSTSRSGRFVYVGSHSAITSEIHFVPADRPEQALRVVAPRRPGVEYDVADHGDTFFVLTNDGAPEFKIATVSMADPGPENWKDFLPPRDEVYLEGIDTFAGYLVVSQRRRGSRAVVVHDLRTRKVRAIDVPEEVYDLWIDDNPEWDTETLRWGYASFVTPRSLYDLDLSTWTSTLRKQQPVPGHDPMRYEVDRLEAVAADGKRVPISIVHPRDDGAHRPRAWLLEAYGAYGVSSDPDFSVARLALLDHGLGYAIAHVRGGGELGRAWHGDGKLMRKRNTFGDFIASAETLIALGYTSNDRLAITGTSAGGLLIGAVLNERPDLFAVAVADVPFVDALNTMLDPSLPLTITEFDEWGDPRRREAFEYIASYSPYDNVRSQDYPHLLVLAAWSDPRVGYWEPAKWVAKLRNTKIDHNTLLLRTSFETGHAGAASRYDALREIAFQYAFILHHLPRQ